MVYFLHSGGQNTFPFDFSDKSTFSTDLWYLALEESKKIWWQFFKCHLGYFTDQNGNTLKITYFAISSRKIDIFHRNFDWTSTWLIAILPIYQKKFFLESVYFTDQSLFWGFRSVKCLRIILFLQISSFRFSLLKSNYWQNFKSVGLLVPEKSWYL